MFGALRLFLAFLVALSHTGRSLYGINEGVSAVTVFFIISGYTMTGLLRAQDNKPKSISILQFYANRLIRIYPQFLLFLLLSALFFEATGFRDHSITEHISVKNILFSMAIMPLDWVVIYGYLPIFSVFESLGRYILMHPAWSLGLELQFYFLLPFILWAKGRSEIIWVSFIVFVFAAIQFLDQPTFGYYFIPGVLFIFLSGSLLYDCNKGNAKAGILLTSLYVCMIVLGAACAYSGKLASYNLGVFVGYILGLPLVVLLSRLERHKLDEWLGSISYGVFLSHVLIINATIHFKLFDVRQNLTLYFACTFVAGAAGYYLVERPILNHRKKARGLKNKIQANLNAEAT